MPRIYTEQELREGMAEIIKIATECELTWQEGKAEAMKGYLKDAMSLVKAACYFKDDPDQPWLSVEEIIARVEANPELMKSLRAWEKGYTTEMLTPRMEPPYVDPC